MGSQNLEKIWARRRKFICHHRRLKRCDSDWWFLAPAICPVFLADISNATTSLIQNTNADSGNHISGFSKSGTMNLIRALGAFYVAKANRDLETQFCLIKLETITKPVVIIDVPTRQILDIV